MEPGEEARDEGMARVLKPNAAWLKAALETIATFGSRNFTGEQLRHALEPTIGPPTDPHAWGALTAAAIRRGLLLPTREYVRMKDKTSNARETKVYWTGNKIGTV